MDQGVPWRIKEENFYDQGITCETWIALWQQYFSLSPREAFKSLVYIGFGGKMREVVTIVKYKETDRLKETGHKQKVYNAYVISHHNTAAQVKLLDAFVND